MSVFLTEAELHYLGGQFDVDGCVLITLPSLGRRHLGFVTVKFDKSVKNKVFLDWLVEKSGGQNSKKERDHKKPNCNNSQQWILERASAVVFCSILKRYSILKQAQLDLAAAFPSHRVKLSRQNKSLRGMTRRKLPMNSLQDCGASNQSLSWCCCSLPQIQGGW